MHDLRLIGIARLEADFLFVFADNLDQVIRDTFAKLMDTGLRMTNGTRHCEDHAVCNSRCESL
tara:strand:+ start:2189 stop:2377 length:189 start_codon:yes stop_codon:yes gene_type:complete